jgi:hypothetical protein
MNIKVQNVKTDWTLMPSGVTWLFVGQPKSGKTTAASKWSEKGADGVLIIDTESGTDWCEDANVIHCNSINIPFQSEVKDGVKLPVTKKVNGKDIPVPIPPEERGFYCRTGKDKGKPMPVYSMVEILNWLRKEWDKLPYDTIVIDTISAVNEWIERIVQTELGINAMGEGSWGSDWALARKKNVDIMVRLQQLMKKYAGNLIINAHSKSTMVTDGKAQLSPDLPRGLSASLVAKADVIGYTTVNKDGSIYEISFKSYDERTIGSRLKPLAQKTLPLEYQAIKDEIVNYKKESE